MKLTKMISLPFKRVLEQCFFVGRLATEQEVFTLTRFDSNVYHQYAGNDLIYFHIKCLSPIPETLREYLPSTHMLFTGNTYERNNLQKISHFMQSSHPTPEEVPYVREGMTGKLIVFSLYLAQDLQSIYVKIHQIEDELPKTFYQCIPSPQAIGDGLKQDEFERRLIEGGYTITLSAYPNIFDRPRLIYFQGKLYHHLHLGVSNVATNYVPKVPCEVTYVNYALEDFEPLVSVRIGSDLYFIEEEQYNALLKTIMEKEKPLVPSYLQQPFARKRDVKKNVPKSSTEYAFLQRLHQNSLKKGLYFEPSDFINFHISAKTSRLTVIGGMSGTGKTQLAQLYGETLNLTYGKEMLLIPISPSYHEPNDILGFYHPTLRRYFESETGLVELLLHAQANPEQLHMVIFDEMNLSQVEHWFSPFLSILELEARKRYLRLYTSHDGESDPEVPPVIKIGENIIFVGTVNFDETTKAFSDRLLDRMNIITPNQLSFQQSLTLKRYIGKDDHCLAESVSNEQFRSEWIYHEGTLSDFTDKEIEFFDLLHEKISTFDPQKGVSYRVVRSIAHYLANIPVDERGKILIDRKEAFDMQIAQRILTKIKGHESVVEPLVGSFQYEEYKPGRLAEFLNSEQAQQVSAFTHSQMILKRKAKELIHYGFTS